MSVVVDFEETRHHAANERLLAKMFDIQTVNRLVSLRSKTNYHLIARVSGVLFGSLVAVTLTGANKGIVQVLAIAVEPRQRHHHIALMLLKALVEEARREHRNHVMTRGPAARFQALGWTRIQNLDPGAYSVHNYQESELPLEAWWSLPTRTFMPKPLSNLPDPAQIHRDGLVVRDNIHPTSRRFGPISG